jgi:GT2 family glycosyltransferase
MTHALFRGDERSGNERIAVVVPTHNRRATTLRFVEQSREWLGPRDELIIVDDGSTDGTVDAIRQSAPATVVLEGDGSLWWAGATNRGVEYALAKGFDYILTINDDSTPENGFLVCLLETARAHPNTIVGAILLHATDPETVWACGGKLGFWDGRLFGLRFHDRPLEEALRGGRWQSVDMLPGCGVLVPGSAYRHVGLYDAGRFPQYHADSEFSIRAKRHGYGVVVDTDARISNDVEQTARWHGLWSAVSYKGSPHYVVAIWGILRYAPNPVAAAVAFPMYYARLVVDRLLQTLGVRPRTR